ncbi:transcriptional regulator [Marinomonas primoryensis]|uniref:Transcriptional regulator n=1 Tax=Marinomonas primoryensis TaxID=178399 RepID=A0A2Z4PML3_9GAMM|nr:Mor transcription activator family protein [Marinomonas primoryensis]AWX98694.1 transcriptional regulator [Marinomonas primoryensis]
MKPQTRDETTIDAFGYSNVSIDTIEHIDDENCRWPEAMRQIYDILKHELDKTEKDSSIALRQLSAICDAFGGMQFYLPRGHRLEKELKHLRIWNEFNGHNVQELCQKYKLSMQQIYRVIANMRQHETNKRQAQLF